MKTNRILKTVMIAVAGYFILSVKLSAQNSTIISNGFSNAIGVRFGETSGLTYKHKFDSKNTMEFIIGSRRHVFGLTGLYERNIQTGVPGFDVYFGAGAHIGQGYYRSWGYYGPHNDRYYYRGIYSHGPVLGVDGIAGIEYKIPKAPLALSLDMKPFVEFYRYRTYFNLDPGLGIKFTF